jgi:CheY-like chemotaxis protein
MAGHVLVVEEDTALSTRVCGALRDEGGFDVEWVVSELAAYRRIPSLPTLDGLVLDVSLGNETTGYDIARFARQVIPTIAVVYIGSEASPPSYRAFAVPDSLFLEKPFTPDALVAALTQQFNRQRQG